MSDQAKADDGRIARLGQYLDFVKLYSEVHKDVSNAKKEANVVWKEKIRKGNDEAWSYIDYLEQLAILKSQKLLQQNPGHVGSDQSSEYYKLEFACAGAKSSVEIAGTFNNWSPEPLKYSSKEENWFTTLHLAPGKISLLTSSYLPHICPEVFTTTSTWWTASGSTTPT